MIINISNCMLLKDVYFALEDKYTKNASLHVTEGSGDYSFFYDYTLSAYQYKLNSLETYTREEIAKILFLRVQEEY